MRAAACTEMRRLVCAVLVAVALLVPTFRTAHAQFTRFQGYSDEQGLDNLAVTALAQERDGAILIGTQGGLYRYDGSTIRAGNDGMPSESWVLQLLADDAGHAWAVTTGGLYVRWTDRFQKVVMPGPLEASLGDLDPASPHVLAMAGGHVVLLARGVLTSAPVGAGRVGGFQPLFGKDVLAAVPGLARARFVAADADGGLLVGCGTAVCSVRNGHVTAFGPAQRLPSDSWQIATRTPDGTLWARSRTQLAWLKPGQAAFTVTPIPDQPPANEVPRPEPLDLVADQHGNLLTEAEDGLVGWTGTGWHHYASHVGGLPPFPIRTLLFDREGSLWAGSEGAGAFRSIGLAQWEHWTAEDGLPSNVVWSIVQRHDRQVWAATDRGSIPLGHKDRAVSGGSYALAVSRRDRVWAAPFSGPLLRIDRSGNAADRLPALGAALTALVDGNNQLWVGTEDGLFLIPDADAPMSGIRPQRLLSRRTLQVTTDPSGSVLVLDDHELLRSGPGNTLVPMVPAALLPERPTGAAFASDDVVWIGTDSGLRRFRVSGSRAEPLPPITTPDIASNSIMFLRRDSRGWMWVGTSAGIDMFDGRAWRHFNSSDGPITSDMDRWGVAEDADGSMWFGTSHGVSHLLAPGSLQPPATLHPVITGLTFGRAALPPSPLVHAAWSRSPLVIDVADMDYAQGHDIAFRYRLRGLDTAWHDTSSREIQYADLPAGTFAFELVAVAPAHHLVSRPVGFTMRILEPWWRRWWFYCSCLLLSVLVLAASWRARVRLLLGRQRRLEDLVRLRTVEIDQAREELQHQAALEQRRLEEMVRNRTAEIEQARSELQRLAMSDSLTGLPNRRSIMTTLEQAIADASASKTPLAVLLCDIDHFKEINDTFGHLAGDAVLAAFGSRLGSIVEPTEAAGRYGGEEFLVILPATENAVMKRVNAVRSAVSDAPYVLDGFERVITSSGGLSFLRPDDTATTLVARADTALYDAKDKGRNRIETEHSGLTRQQRTRLASEQARRPPDDAAVPRHARTHGMPERWPDSGRLLERHFQQRRDLERDLRTALAEGQFALHYQPVVDIAQNAVTACEALLRWHSPTRGEVVPAEFIPFAEESGLMPQIGDWVLRTACREAARWTGGPRIAVNLSPVQFRLLDLVDRVAAALLDAGLPAERLELEVTETAMIDDIPTATAILDQLRALGVTIALDDFGTGYSSLSFIRTLPFDRIKIDRTFVQDLDRDPEAAAIVNAMAGLCARIGASVTAEGVETERQLDMLRTAGCTDLQGYLIGRPCAAPQIRAWMKSFSEDRAGLLVKVD